MSKSEHAETMEAPADSCVAPSQILLGRYRVERVLGQGGMGTVVSARHLELGQLVAFKFLRAEAALSDTIVERFVREARAAGRLSGDHVAKVHDVGRMPSGQPYMIMEQLKGVDLEQLLVERGPLPIPEIVRYVLEACDAIQEAHKAGIVHRDLKPSNLFLHEPRPDKRVIKVLDFGISKDTTSTDAKLTSTHAILGSPLYMSPEQATEPLRVDPRSDLWALGVVMYELATGEVPFIADTVPSIVAKILQHDPPPPSALRPQIPAWYDAIVLRCLRKSMTERYASVDELVLALRPHATTAGSAPELSRDTLSEMPLSLRATAQTPIELAQRRTLPPRRRALPILIGAGVIAALATVALQLRPVAPPAQKTPGGAATAEEMPANPPTASPIAPPDVAPDTAAPTPAAPTESGAPVAEGVTSSSAPPIRTGRPRATSSPSAKAPIPAPTHDPLDKL